jgi:hypothetical protein
MVRSLLLYVNPSETEAVRRVTVAADLVEALTFASDDPEWPRPPRIGVVAERTHCIEIGLPMLGREHVRLSDRNQRPVSPVTLFPFDDRRPSLPVTVRRAATERLRELAAIGAVAPLHPRFETGEPVSAESALELASDGPTWDLVVQLGVAPPLLAVKGLIALERMVPLPMGDTQNVERLLGLLEPAGPDDHSTIRRQAVEDAVLFASIMERIDGDGDERTRGAFSVSVS